MSLTAVLISSPFLGPAVWSGVEAELREGFGTPATTVAVHDSDASDPDAILAALRERLPPGEELLLVPHSNAGLYAPALALDAPRRRVVFVDAILPPPNGTLPVAPPGLRDALAAEADEDGLLPPWTGWWPERVVDELFPDAATKASVEAGQRRMPLAYLDARVEVPDGWDRAPAAYLAFGDAYADERDDARSRGWPVETMDGGHLHMLREPAAVAAAIIRLAAA
ncbi:hypothetical protein [Glycomyces salinus]|uniref:hypothetical protein n=1 Tax=Glycomyces salinus TaxID=980294 RepID=UPI0018EDC0FE|nr:hypothetical protein [Glycomyces salinus]